MYELKKNLFGFNNQWVLNPKNDILDTIKVRYLKFEI